MILLTGTVLEIDQNEKVTIGSKLSLRSLGQANAGTWPSFMNI